MSTTTINSFSRAGANLLSAIDAVRNVRALLLMLGTMVCGTLLWTFGAYTGLQVGVVLGAVFFLLGAVVFFYGTNAVGIMLMDQAKGEASRPVAGAILQSLAASHRLLLVILMVGGVYLLGMVGLTILLFICKIPLLGPLLFTFVFPLSVVLAGVAMFALSAVIFPLASPAVWAGAGAVQAVSHLAAIVRSRLVNVLIMMAMLFIMTAAVGAFVALVMFIGTAIASGLAAPILGGMGNLASFTGGMGQTFGSGGASAYMVAGSVGGGVVYAMAFSLPALVYVRGCCQVYLASIENLDTEAFEAKVRERLEATRQRAEALRRQHVQPEVVPTLNCPQCQAALLPGDKFCGNCGSKTI